jgi:hypothetical protein
MRIHLATSYSPLHHAVVAQRGGGTPQSLSSFYLHTFPFWRTSHPLCIQRKLKRTPKLFQKAESTGK